MKGKYDKEYISLRNRFLLALFVALIFGALALALVFNKFYFGNTINSKISKKESFVIFINSYECENCNEVQKILDDKGVIYEEVVDNEADSLYKKLGITNTEEVVPSVIYMKKGKMYSSLFEIKNYEELKAFLEYYKLTNMK